MKYNNGDRFVGYWHRYKWHGDGEFHFANGCVLKANVVENGYMNAIDLDY